MTEKPGTDDLVATIVEVYPDLHITSARLIHGQGQNNRVLVLNDELIFRFPLHAAGVAGLEREIGILRGVRARVPLATPNPVYVSLDDRRPGKAFVGYPVIPGEPLHVDIMESLDHYSVLEELGYQAGRFLRALHQLRLNDVLPGESARLDPLETWHNLYRRIRERLFPMMRPDARIATADHFTAFFDRCAGLEISPVLVHGDLGPSHLLYDPRTYRLAGVVDFGSAGPGDPAVDFAALASAPEPFLAGLGRVYPLVAQVGERIRFYRGTFALQEALFGIEQGNEKAFRAGIASYV